MLQGLKGCRRYPSVGESSPIPSYPPQHHGLRQGHRGLWGSLVIVYYLTPLSFLPPLPTPSCICMVDPEMLPSEQARLLGSGPYSEIGNPCLAPGTATCYSQSHSVTAAKTKRLADAVPASVPLSSQSEPSDKGRRAP